MSDAYSAAIKDLTLTWRINNFEYFWKNLISPPFTSRCFNDSIFYLIVRKHTLPRNNQSKICIATNNGNLPPLDYEVALVSSDASPEESMKKRAFEFEANLDRGASYDEWIREILVVPTKTILEERRDAFLPHDTLTIRCRLKQRDADFPESEEIFATTSIEVRRKLFTCTLDETNKEWHEYLFSIPGTYGYLEFKASIKRTPAKRLFLEVHRDEGKDVLSILKISLLGEYGKERQLTNETFLFSKSELDQVWQLPSLIIKNELLASKTQLLPNGTLSLKCDFTASLGNVGGSEIVACPKDLISSSNDYERLRFCQCQANGKLPSGSRQGDLKCILDAGSLQSDLKCILDTGSLQSDLKCILDTGSLSDFKLRVDSDVFPVHKSLLGARSPVFNAMFTNDYKETCGGQVLIADISSDSIRRFLIYLYTDRIDGLTVGNAPELYFAADKYGVLCLKEICASFLKANLSSSSACAVLVLADRHQDEKLKSAVQDFISKHDSEIFRSEDWQDLEKSNHLLAFETLREICLKKSIK